MKKFLVFVLLVVFLLSACAAGQQASVTQQPTEIVYVTPSASLATPAVGFAVVRRLEGMQALLLRSGPDPESPLAGQIAPGAMGTLIGINETGAWVLLDFKDQSQSGWAPIEALDLTVAQ